MDFSTNWASNQQGIKIRNNNRVHEEIGPKSCQIFERKKPNFLATLD